jgi:hypothetical protein
MAEVHPARDLVKAINALVTYVAAHRERHLTAEELRELEALDAAVYGLGVKAGLMAPKPPPSTYSGCWGYNDLFAFRGLILPKEGRPTVVVGRSRPWEARMAALRAAAEAMVGSGKKVRSDAILFYGDLQYGVGDRRVTVTENEDNVLQAFLGSPALTKKQLIDKAGPKGSPAILAALRKKYGRLFAPYIKCPGAKGKGGYRVAVRLASDAASDA